MDEQDPACARAVSRTCLSSPEAPRSPAPLQGEGSGSAQSQPAAAWKEAPQAWHSSAPGTAPEPPLGRRNGSSHSEGRPGSPASPAPECRKSLSQPAWSTNVSAPGVRPSGPHSAEVQGLLHDSLQPHGVCLPCLEPGHTSTCPSKVLSTAQSQPGSWTPEQHPSRPAGKAQWGGEATCGSPSLPSYSPGSCCSGMSTKCLSSLKSLASWTCLRSSPVQ